MAYTKLAIVHGEWQLDPDQQFRLYVNPTLEIIDGKGVTHHVSAFAADVGRPDEPLDATPSSFVCPTSYSCHPTGGEDRETFLSSDGRWLEPVTPQSRSFEMLGELTHDCTPIMAALVLKSSLQWHSPDMEPHLVCIEDAVETNQFDGEIIELLKRLKV